MRTSVPFSPTIVTISEATSKPIAGCDKLFVSAAVLSCELARYSRLSIRTTKSATFWYPGRATPVNVTAPGGSSGCSAGASMSVVAASATRVSSAGVSGTTQARPRRNSAQGTRGRERARGRGFYVRGGGLGNEGVQRGRLWHHESKALQEFVPGEAGAEDAVGHGLLLLEARLEVPVRGQLLQAGVLLRDLPVQLGPLFL